MTFFKSTTILVLLLAVLSLALRPAAAAMDSSTNVIDATKAGVVGDGATINTAAIQKLIDDTSAVGGGVIEFPAGQYLTGTIQLKSGVTLRIDDSATLLGSTDAADYRNLDPFLDGSGNQMGSSLIVAVDADNVGIEGKGTIDGQGLKLAANQHPFVVRPFLLRWLNCKNVSLHEIHLTNPGAWTLNFFQTDGAVIDGVKIRSRAEKLQNNDGIDLDSSQNIKITNCDIVSGDDAIVIKTTSKQPSQNIDATNCDISTHTNAIKFGTESIGDFENISVSNCRITNTGMSGIVLNSVDGGNIRHVNISDITMDGVAAPICVRLGARLKTFRTGDTAMPHPGTISDVAISNVTAKNVRSIGILINGVPGYPVGVITLSNIQIAVRGGGTADDAAVQLPEKATSYPEYSMFGKTLPAYGLYARHVDGLTLHNVQLTPLLPDARPSTVLLDVSSGSSQ